MAWFDYLVVTLIAFFVIRGLLTGIVRTVASFLGVLAGFLYASKVSKVILPYLKWLTKAFSPKFLPVIAFCLAFLGIYFFFFLMGLVFRFILGTLSLRFIDRIGGAVFGLLKGCVLVTLFYVLLKFFAPNYALQIKKNCKTYPLIKFTLSVGEKVVPDTFKGFIKDS